MPFAKDDLIEALRLRYDHYSALSVFELARERSGLADKPTYDASELRAWRDALSKVGDRVGKVLTCVDELLETSGSSAAEPRPSRADHDPASRAAKPAKPEPEAATAPAGNPAPGKHTADKSAADKSAADKSARETPAQRAAAKTDDKPATIETTIVLRGVEVSDGDKVLVCGTGAMLGDWDPERARPMTRAGDEWRVTVTVDAHSPLAFKFLRRAPDGTITWEGGDNREVPVADRIEATWR